MASIASGYTALVASGDRLALTEPAGENGRTPRPPAGGEGQGRFAEKRTEKEKGEVPVKKKTAILTARLTPAEKAAIERRAKQANMTVTDYIVKCALGKNVRQTDELAPVLSELKAQGRNLNQLTKLANMGRITLVDAENFTEAYTNLYGLIEEIYWEVE